MTADAIQVVSSGIVPVVLFTFETCRLSIILINSIECVIILF